MTLTPPTLPDGYHWDIGRNFSADIVHGRTRHVITAAKLDVQTADELHERCTLAVKTLERIIETRDAILNTTHLPDGWTAELDQDATHTVLLKKNGEADVKITYAHSLNNGIYPSDIEPGFVAVDRCVQACKHTAEAIAYRDKLLAG